MALETYSWPIQDSGSATTLTQAVRSVGFGDGYKQIAALGINATSRSIPMTHFGKNSEVDTIQDFLLSHTVKAFAITPPGAPKGLYRVDATSITRTPKGPLFSVLSFTLTTANGIYA